MERRIREDDKDLLAYSLLKRVYQLILILVDITFIKDHGYIF